MGTLPMADTQHSFQVPALRVSRLTSCSWFTNCFEIVREMTCWIIALQNALLWRSKETHIVPPSRRWFKHTSSDCGKQTSSKMKFMLWSPFAMGKKESVNSSILSRIGNHLDCSRLFQCSCFSISAIQLAMQIQMNDATKCVWSLTADKTISQVQKTMCTGYSLVTSARTQMGMCSKLWEYVVLCLKVWTKGRVNNLTKASVQ